jgi:hypothetical protein
MYNLRYSNPRFSGNIYLGTHRCGKPNCRCAKSKKYWHSAYYLEYKELVDGQWKRKREYIPKKKVRALRARIKRNKQREKETKKAVKEFLNQVPGLKKRLRNHSDLTARAEAKKLTDKMLEIKPLNFRQLMQITKEMVSISVAPLKPIHHKKE